MRRALAIAVAVLVATPATALGADVRVTGTGGQSSTVSLGSMSEDVRDREYTIGGSSRQVTGFSLESVLEAAGGDPYNWQYLEVMRPGGGSVILTDEQVFDDVFPDGPPVVTDEGSATGFIRPATGQGGDPGEEVVASPLDVRLREGNPFEVSVSTSTTKTKPGEDVELSASVTQAPAGEELVYSWSFGDGERGSGQSTSHSFEKPGSYNVIVGVGTSTQETQGNDAVRIDVGKLEKGGPDREGGGRNEADDAPDSGAADGGSGTGSGGYGAGSGGSPEAGGDGGGRGAPEERDQEPRAPGGERVVGELLSASRATEAAEEGEAAGARTGTPAEESGFALPGAVVAFLVVGGLLGVGGLKELRG